MSKERNEDLFYLANWIIEKFILIMDFNIGLRALEIFHYFCFKPFCLFILGFLAETVLFKNGT